MGDGKWGIKEMREMRESSFKFCLCSVSVREILSFEF
jgi:hypothetical protein